MVTRYLTYWRGVALHGREILEGRVADAHRGPSPELARSLAAWEGSYYWDDAPDGRWLVLIRESAKPRERWWLHAVLFLATLLTTSFAGAAFHGDHTWLSRPSLALVARGLSFSLPLLAILCAHESGHYLFARRYRIDTSPPYFIPFPWQVSPLGTMGAFIRLRSPIFDRRTLFDVGVAGPLAGLLIAVPVLVAGLARSAVVPGLPGRWFAHQVVPLDGLDGDGIWLGDSLLMLALRKALAVDGVLRLHPLAIAGWVGLFITMLNMLPFAQLDGGHATFALFGRAQLWIARVCWVALVALGALWPGWWLWAAVGLVIGRGRLAHPRILSPERPVTAPRRRLGYAALILSLVCFTPVPFTILQMP